jgi:hypothetical protein
VKSFPFISGGGSVIFIEAKTFGKTTRGVQFTSILSEAVFVERLRGYSIDKFRQAFPTTSSALMDFLGTSQSGLPDGIFQTKNPNFGQFWRVLQWNVSVYLMVIWYIFPDLV